MENNQSLQSLLLSFLSRRLDPTAGRAGAAVDSREIIREYAVREINLLLWFSLIAITILLLKQLARIFDLWRKGNRIPGRPCLSFYGQLRLFAGNNLQEDLTGLLSKSHEKYESVIKDPVLIKEMLSKALDELPLTGRAHHLALENQSSLFPLMTSTELLFFRSYGHLSIKEKTSFFRGRWEDLPQPAHSAV